MTCYSPKNTDVLIKQFPLTVLRLNAKLGASKHQHILSKSDIHYAPVM